MRNRGRSFGRKRPALFWRVYVLWLGKHRKRPDFFEMSWPACLSCVCSYGICTILTGEICEMLRIYKWEGSGYNTIKMWERFHIRTHKNMKNKQRNDWKTYKYQGIRKNRHFKNRNKYGINLIKETKGSEIINFRKNRKNRHSWSEEISFAKKGKAKRVYCPQEGQ